MRQQPIEPLLQTLQAQGAAVHSLEADLANAANISALFDTFVAMRAPVGVIVYEHALCAPETFDAALARESDGESEDYCPHLLSAAQIDAHFSVNARTYALLMAEYTQRYLARGAHVGRIIKLSAGAAHAHVGNVSYAASKHAIESYSRSAASKLGKYGITVNVVTPGPIQTGYITQRPPPRWILPYFNHIYPARQRGFGAENTQALGIVSMRPLLIAVVVY